ARSTASSGAIGDAGARAAVACPAHAGSRSPGSSFPPGKTTAPPRKPPCWRFTQNTSMPPAVVASRTTTSVAASRGGGPWRFGSRSSISASLLRSSAVPRRSRAPAPHARLEQLLHSHVLDQPPRVVLGRRPHAVERQRQRLLGLDSAGRPPR